MDISLKTVIWQQFGAEIDMLDNTLRACPDQLWRESVWIDPTDAPCAGACLTVESAFGAKGYFRSGLGGQSRTQSRLRGYDADY